MSPFHESVSPSVGSMIIPVHRSAFVLWCACVRRNHHYSASTSQSYRDHASTPGYGSGLIMLVSDKELCLI